MPTQTIFTTIRTEGALLPPDLLQRISEGNVDGLRPEDYHRPGEKLNEVINRSWNALQGAWASFRSAQALLPPSDIGTTLTRERWLLPLFRELDYGRLQTAPAVEIDGRSYPISHGWENVPIHLVSYQVKLDERTARVAGAASASPHSLLQVFLNRSDDKLWGFLSNGYRLRILRDNASLTRQAYVEFDLEAMMEGEVYSDFVLLWLLAHQSRVEGGRDCWLEKWMKVAEEQGTRALDQLRDGVERAITALGSGFLERSENGALRDGLTHGGLDKQDYYRQLLRLVYRLLFLFVAEDRGLLYDPESPEASREIYRKYYSTQRLRRMAESFKGTNHPDLYVGLRLVMQVLEGDGTTATGQQRILGAQRLGLPTLGSFLFSDEAVADVIGCQISNRNLLDAVRALALVYDEKVKVYRSIDYKNLGPEELGSVYESLLELHPQINVPARSFALATAGGNERKTTGSYYTPTSLINALLDSALDPVLDEAVYGVGGRAKNRAPLRDAEAHILALKVCDPACGSGHFLIAAANRIAKALASIRTGEEEPPPSAIEHAKRDVIGHCIYGVDINPMAVELCKVNLWMEALEAGKPLSFLDHRIQVGNSLLGTTPRLMAEGIPSDAFNPIEGDDKAVVSKLRKQNAQERKDYESGQRSLFDVIEPPADYRRIATDLRELDALDDATLAGIRAKEAHYRALANDPEVQKAHGLADAWCAAFVWEKTEANTLPPMTDRAYRLMSKDPLGSRFEDVRAYIARLSERYQFFHWHVAFPDVFDVPNDLHNAANEQTGWDGGFNVVLGNPPWDMVELNEKEFFAQRAPETANAPRASVRKEMIRGMELDDATLYQDYLQEVRFLGGQTHFIRSSELYSLVAHGRLNTYAIFTGLSRRLISESGFSGLIIPTGIATDDGLKEFFNDLIVTRSLSALIGFENEEFLFPAVANVVRYCIFVVGGTGREENNPTYAFYIRNTNQMRETQRFFELSPEDIELINPNTKNSPIFRTKYDAEITKSVYRRLPILVREQDGIELSHWGISSRKGLFNMASDSNLFETEIQEGHVPLYEGKLIWHFDHRFGSYDLVGSAKGKGGRGLPFQVMKNYVDPYYFIQPRYWVARSEVEKRIPEEWEKDWLILLRDIASAKLERTGVFAIAPRIGAGDSAPLIFPIASPSAGKTSCLVACLNSLILDFVLRQKVGGTHLNFYIVNQIPVIPPETYNDSLTNFILARVLELTYTAWDLQSFAQDVGYEGAPFMWNKERRSVMRCELDALFFHLYGLNREETNYVLDPVDIFGEDFPGETFRVLKEKEMAEHGEYMTKRIILEMYDQMAALPQISVPAPKGDGEYRVPDVAQWQTWLDPEPASPLAAHKNGEV